MIGICSIAIVSVVAFWGLGLAEKIMPQKTTLHEKIMPQEIVLQDKIMPPEKISQVLDVPSANKPEPITKNPILSSVSGNVEPKGTVKPASEKKPSKTEKPAKPLSNLELLEKKEFQLTLSGTYHAGSPNAAKSAYIAMKIRPVSGSGLENFKVTEAKMTLDNSRISVKNPSVSIKGSNVLMIFTSDTVGSFVIKGMLDEPVLSDKNNKQTLVIQNQLFYLTQKNVPYHLDMTGTLSNY